jgi:hypothetical protein
MLEKPHNKDSDSKPDQEGHQTIGHNDAIRDSLLYLLGLGSAIGTAVSVIHNQTLLLWVVFVCFLIFLVLMYLRWHDALSRKGRLWGISSTMLALFVMLIACIILQLQIWIRDYKTSDTSISKTNTDGASKTMPSPVPQSMQMTNGNQNQSRHAVNSSSVQKDKTARLNENKGSSKDVFLLSEETGEPILFSEVKTENNVAGNVAEFLTGAALNGATITIKSLYGDEYKTISKFDGSFSRKLPFGQYTVTVSYPGYLSETHFCIISDKKGCYVGFNNMIKIPPKPDPR